MNAKSAIGYAFVISKDLGTRNKVYSGEFIYRSELGRVIFDNFDGYIDFQHKTLKNLETEDVIKLAINPN